MKYEYEGSVLAVRAVEDAIRATKRYTKGLFRRPADYPIQGNGFPSRVLTEYYEVYPTVELTWDMSASDAWAWVWGDVPRVDVWCWYDYRSNRAKVVIRGTAEELRLLLEHIPGLRRALDLLEPGRAEERGNGCTYQASQAWQYRRS